MANGCAVVTEPSSGFEPLVAGEHFIETDDVATTLVGLLNDPARCERLGAAAAQAVLEDHPLRASLAPVLEEAASSLPMRQRRALVPRRSEARLRRLQQIPLLPAFAPATEVPATAS